MKTWSGLALSFFVIAACTTPKTSSTTTAVDQSTRLPVRLHPAALGASWACASTDRVGKQAEHKIFITQLYSPTVNKLVDDVDLQFQIDEYKKGQPVGPDIVVQGQLHRTRLSFEEMIETAQGMTKAAIDLTARSNDTSTELLTLVKGSATFRCEPTQPVTMNAVKAAYKSGLPPVKIEQNLSSICFAEAATGANASQPALVVTQIQTSQVRDLVKGPLLIFQVDDYADLSSKAPTAKLETKIITALRVGDIVAFITPAQNGQMGFGNMDAMVDESTGKLQSVIRQKVKFICGAQATEVGGSQ